MLARVHTFYSTSRTNTIIVDEVSFVSVTHPTKTVLIRKGQSQPASSMQSWEKLVAEIMNGKALKCDIAGNQLRFVTDPSKKGGANAEYSMDQLSMSINNETCKVVEFERTFSINGQKQKQKIVVLSSSEVEAGKQKRIEPQSLVYDASGKIKSELKSYELKDLR